MAEGSESSAPRAPDVPSGAAVEVVYALPEAQHIVSVPLVAGLTAADAVTRSGLPDRFPAIGREPLVLGLFGQRIDPEYPVAAGDRIEICRPLQLDPRELRRAVATTGGVIGQRDRSNDEQ